MQYMETYTSITYSVHKKNAQSITKIEYNSSLKDDNKLVNTCYSNYISDNIHNESFTKTLKDNNDTYEQIGISSDKKEWNVKEYHNNSCQKEYTESYNAHNFDECITECIPSLANLNETFLIENQ